MSSRAMGVGTSGVTIDGRIVGAALLLLVVLVWQAGQAAGPNMAALAVVGGLLGLVLHHASFGFTAAWRRFVTTGEGHGLRAQMLMLALAVCLFFPALAAGELFGRPVGGFVFPVGLGVVAGAFVFGIGMQLGGGCGSGTLFTVGGGSTRMVLTLFFFVAGSVVAIGHLPFWHGLPGIGGVSAITMLGLWPALLLHLALFALIVALTLQVERRRGVSSRPRTAGDWLRGPWPILAGAAALAVLNFLTLWLAGRPWGITSAFALWGAKGLDALGSPRSPGMAQLGRHGRRHRALGSSSTSPR
ncbi:MAG: YeeE/YedE thiosulfate transporter family protein [Geminicoccaceae bacterium]